MFLTWGQTIAAREMRSWLAGTESRLSDWG
jgi:hypothetical protein